MKDGSSLVVTPSFIPNSATYRPNANLSSDEGSEKVLEDFKDEPVIKKKFLILIRMMVMIMRLRLWVCVSCPC